MTAATTDDSPALLLPNGDIQHPAVPAVRVLDACRFAAGAE